MNSIQQARFWARAHSSERTHIAAAGQDVGSQHGPFLVAQESVARVWGLDPEKIDLQPHDSRRKFAVPSISGRFALLWGRFSLAYSSKDVAPFQVLFNTVSWVQFFTVQAQALGLRCCSLPSLPFCVPVLIYEGNCPYCLWALVHYRELQVLHEADPGYSMLIELLSVLRCDPGDDVAGAGAPVHLPAGVGPCVGTSHSSHLSTLWCSLCPR